MKLVVLSSRFPFPLEKGDKLRLYHQIRSLSEVYDVYLLSLIDHEIPSKHIDALLNYCKEVKTYKISKPSRLLSAGTSLFSKKPLQVAYYFNKSIKSRILGDIKRIGADHIYCQLGRMAEYIRKVNLPKTLDYMDAFSVGMERRAKVVPFWQAWIYRLEAKRMALYEKEIVKDFDQVTIISQQDKKLLQIKDLEVVPNGVDLDYFQPVSTSKKYDLAFVGNMGYLPNIAAAEFLCTQIHPSLQKSIPKTRIILAGARPDPRVKHLGNSFVTVSGWVEDIRNAYSESKLFIAPLFNGTGQQNKILEAMAMGIPVITSIEVNDAIGAKAGEEIIVANDKRSFVRSIENLLKDPKKMDYISKNALNFVHANFGWESQNKKLIKLLRKNT